MINFSILSGEKVRKIAIVQASLIALFILVYFLVVVDTKKTIRMPKGSAIQSDTMMLGSGLEVLLLSDPNAVKSAAALSVGVGSNADDIPGLAHFVEHLLFIASSKYTTPDQFTTFITENGGYSNAFTDCEQTNFYFDVKHSALQIALDMFAGFFTHPLFPSDRLTDEVKAVDSEHEKNLLSDQWREMRLIELMANEEHPFYHFASGSAETLYRENLLDMAQLFFQKWYKGGNMKMVVISNQNTRLLKLWVSRAFIYVPRGPIPPHSYPKAFPTLKKVAFAPRIAEGHTLTLAWPLPPQASNFETLPIPFIRYLLNLATPTGLASELRNKKLVHNLEAYYMVDYSDFSMLGIYMELTQAGLKSWRECLKSVSNYVASLADLSDEEMKAAWDFYLAASTMAFDYQTEIVGGSTASDLASNMHKFPRAQYITADAIPQQFDYKLIREYLRDYLQNDVIAIVMSSRFEPGKVFDGRKLQLKNKEHYYDLSFEIDDLISKGKPELRELQLPTKFALEKVHLQQCPGCAKVPIQLQDSTWFLVSFI